MAVAFFLAAVGLLPLLLIILFDETGVLVAPPDTPEQLFLDGSIANRQLQVTTLIACVWCGVLALRTRTAALSTVCAVLFFCFGLSVLSDRGLRSWLEDGRWDLLALTHCRWSSPTPAFGAAAERVERPWFARPAYVASALLLVVLLELLAFERADVPLSRVLAAVVAGDRRQRPVPARHAGGDDAQRHRLLRARDDARTSRHGSAGQAAARLLFTLSPFAILQPLGYLVRAGEYSLRYDWIYLGLAVAIATLSQARQRRAFYYAGMLNLGGALYLIADHRHWFNQPQWALAVIVFGLLALGAGFALDRRQKSANLPRRDAD